MPNQRYSVLEDGEPKGERHGEPREDDLNLVVGDDGERHWEDENGKRVCGGKCRDFKTNWQRCRMKRLGVGNRCYRHGGASKTGEENPAFKDGRYSKYLPKGLLERYQEFLDDPELTSLREDLALLDTRLSMILASMDEDYGVGMWYDLQDEYNNVREALRDGDREKMAEAMNRLGSIISQGLEQGEIWNEVMAVVDERRKVASAEHRRVEKASKSLSVEEAMVMVRFLTETVLDVLDRYDVPDKARSEIAEAVRHVHLN